MPNVLVIGHSLTPRNLHIPNVHLTVLRKSGGRLNHLNTEPFCQAFEYSWDVVLIHLGGNDLDDFTPSQCIDKICIFIKKLEVKKVILVETENRKYLEWNRVGEKYRCRSNRLAKLIRSHARFKGWGLVYTRNKSFFDNLRTDGIHLNAQGESLLKNRYEEAIIKALGK